MSKLKLINKKSTFLSFFSLIFFLMSCGTPTVPINEEQYEPKIVVEGYLVPERTIQIKITRNFYVKTDLNNIDLALHNADVSITDLQTEKQHSLSFNVNDGFFEYTGHELSIDYNKSYKLAVSTDIDGKNLYTESTTTVPNSGLHIIGMNHHSLKYRPRNENGEIISPMVEFERSPGTDFYIASVLALDASTDSYIYDNAFDKLSRSEVEDDLDQLRWEDMWITDTPLTAGHTTMELFWWDIMFYGSYQVVIYAADMNYRDFQMTYEDVQEDDGNFHEPLFHFTGDGIGVFGSAVADTVYFEIVR